MLRILIVRLSSMGDVIHAFPAVTEIARHYPNAAIDWVVEEAFVDLVRLHPAVSNVIPFALRRWRQHWHTRAAWREMAAFRDRLQSTRYDLVLDLQGLVKSAVVARLADGPVAGYDRPGIREPLACHFYDRRHAIPWLHAIERVRRLAGLSLGYSPEGPPDYGLRPLPPTFDWLPKGSYWVGLTATSRESKRWPDAHWQALGREAAPWGTLVLPWGSPMEGERAQAIAAQVPGACVAPHLSLPQAASLLADARAVVGVDTGLLHLAAACAVPLIGLYTDSDPALTGAVAQGPAMNLGGIGQIPDVTAVLQALDTLRRDVGAAP
jgi:heptosyltransferase-1